MNYEPIIIETVIGKFVIIPNCDKCAESLSVNRIYNGEMKAYCKSCHTTLKTKKDSK